MNLKEVQTEDGDSLSLVKLTGSNIKDISGTISNDFGVPVFSLSQIHFEDGTSVYVEGEHDIAYIPAQNANKQTPKNLDDETLEDLYEQENGPDDDED